jgi:predicted metal-dependent phosphoesterase TrpH
MVVADCHVHTTVSDGSLAPAAVPEVARDAGLDAVAVTDHDRLPAVPGPTVEREGVTVIAGIELRVEAEGHLVDLLGYGLRETESLRRATERLQADRVERAERIVEAIETRLDVSLDVDYAPGVGRPHIARALAAVHPDYDVQRTFDELIGEGGPCYVARQVPDVETGRSLLAEACEVVALAHPFRYDDVDAALDLVADLDAVERYYPYAPGTAVAPDRLDALIDRHDLLRVGGSDAHGEDLGATGLDRADTDRLLAHL